MAELRVGEVAAHAGVSVDTVRYYERRRLLPHALRRPGGFRVFAPEAVERIRFIKQAQEISLSLDEIRKLLTNAGGAEQCRRVSRLLRAKLDELETPIKTMQNFRRTLAHHLAACERELNEKGQAAQCPLQSRAALARSIRVSSERKRQ